MAKKRKPHNGKPELSDGYVKIANELWQALIDYDFTAAQMKIIAVIIRETYGYNRKSKNLSVSYISKATHLSKVGTRKALDKLIAQKVVTEYCEPTPRASREIGLNKYYLDWGREISEYHSEGNQSRPLPEYHSEGNQ
ncbi:MAG: replication protein, partial [Eubacteriales bacterium]|nr:replication protein [Eubacteriales bacterium]